MRDDRWFTGVAVLAVCLNVAFVVAFVWVATHFIGKYW